MDALEKLSPAERVQRLREIKKKQDKDIEDLIEKAEEESEQDVKRKKDKEKEDVDSVDEDEDIEEIIQKEKQNEEVKQQVEYKIVNQEPEKTYIAEENLNPAYQGEATQKTYSRGGDLPAQQTYQAPDAKKDDEFKREYF